MRENEIETKSTVFNSDNKVFKLKPIKRGGKIPFQQFKTSLKL